MDAKFLRILAGNAKKAADELLAGVEDALENGDREVAQAAATAGAVIVSISSFIYETAKQLDKEPA